MVSKVQVNINSDLKKQAEKIIEGLGFTSTIVINEMYKQIVATGEIPFNISLTPKQKTIMELKEVSKKVPVHDIKSKKDFENFFSED